jgi:hypothetical protein
MYFFDLSMVSVSQMSNARAPHLRLLQNRYRLVRLNIARRVVGFSGSKLPFHRSSKVSALAVTVSAIMAIATVTTCMHNPSVKAGPDNNSRKRTSSPRLQVGGRLIVRLWFTEEWATPVSILCFKRRPAGLIRRAVIIDDRRIMG